MEAELTRPPGRRSDAVTVGLGRTESSFETTDRLRKKANQLVVKQLQTNLRNADIENKRLEQEQKQKEKKAADQEKQRLKEAAHQERVAAATAKKLVTLAKKKAREEENSLSAKNNKRRKCEHCSKFEVGWVYCDGGLGCSVDISDVDDRWHKLCCAGLKSVPTAEIWYCALCL